VFTQINISGSGMAHVWLTAHNETAVSACPESLGLCLDSPGAAVGLQETWNDKSR